MPGHHHECHVRSIGHARKQSIRCTIVTSKAQSEHVQPHAWVGVVCVGEWSRARGVGQPYVAQIDFDMSDMVWLYAVGGPQVHPLTSFALHEV